MLALLDDRAKLGPDNIIFDEPFLEKLEELYKLPLATEGDKNVIYFNVISRMTRDAAFATGPGKNKKQLRTQATRLAGDGDAFYACGRRTRARRGHRGKRDQTAHRQGAARCAGSASTFFSVYAYRRNSSKICVPRAREEHGG